MPTLRLLSTGSNAYGQLGNNTLIDSHIFQPCSFTNHPPNSLPPGTCAVLNAVSGANHTLVLLELVDHLGLKKRELWGCGDGRAGQLGKKYKEDTLAASSTVKFRKIELFLEENGLSGYSYRLISASWETSYVVLSCSGKGDVVISMGSDEFGDLGIGGFTTTAGKQSEKDFHVVKFDHLSTPSGVPIAPTALRVEYITSGQRHTIVHLQISEPPNTPSLLVGWGTSRHGQLGHLAPLSTQKPPPFTSLPRIIELDDIVSSALGIHHSLFLHASGQISALGSNRKGQLQLLPSQNVRTIGCTWNGSYAVIESNEGWHIHSSGSNSHGQLGLKTDPLNPDIPGSGIVHFPQSLDTSIEIACGSEHVLVLSMKDCFAQQALWGWGWNEHGNLGTGNTDDTFLPLKIWSNEPGFASYFKGAHELIGIWAGAGTSWICCSHNDDVR
jgi:protein ATS1